MKKRKLNPIKTKYYRTVFCPRTDCIFNLTGRCYVTKKEHPGILTYDLDCEFISQNSIDEYSDFFKGRTYFVHYRDIFSPDKKLFDNPIDPDRLVKVRVIGTSKDGQIKIKVYLQGERFLTHIDFKTLRTYEMRRRFNEKLKEEEAGLDNVIEFRRAA